MLDIWLFTVISTIQQRAAQEEHKSISNPKVCLSIQAPKYVLIKYLCIRMEPSISKKELRFEAAKEISVKHLLIVLTNTSSALMLNTR